MDFFELIDARYSSRNYTSVDVTEEEIDQILYAIDAGPSSANLQSFKVVVVRDEIVKGQLMEASKNQRWMIKAPVFICFFGDYDNYRAKFGDYKIEDTPLQDATIAMTYAQLAATEMGLASCWVASHARDVAQEILGIEGDLRFAGILTLGRAADTKPRRKRRGPDEWTYQVL